jgi:hypothetical protein
MVILPLKVLKLSNKGSLTISSPLAFAEGLFLFYIYFIKKKDFVSLLLYDEEVIEKLKKIYLFCFPVASGIPGLLKTY